MSGDPSRGAISLEMEEPLLTGQRVQVSLSEQSRGVVRDLLIVATEFRTVHAQAASHGVVVVVYTKAQRGFLPYSSPGRIHESFPYNQSARAGFPAGIRGWE